MSPFFVINSGGAGRRSLQLPTICLSCHRHGSNPAATQVATRAAICWRFETDFSCKAKPSARSGEVLSENSASRPSSASRTSHAPLGTGRRRTYDRRTGWRLHRNRHGGILNHGGRASQRRRQRPALEHDRHNERQHRAAHFGAVAYGEYPRVAGHQFSVGDNSALNLETRLRRKPNPRLQPDGGHNEITPHRRAIRKLYR